MNKRIDTVEFHIVEHCNLNCKSCMHFSPIAPIKYVSTKDFKEDSKLVASIFKDNLNTVHLLGGEPLLHTELTKILKIARYNMPKAKIILISNGILLTKQKTDFWQAMKTFDICLSVTRYPLEINYQIISHLTKKYGINYTFYAPNKENSLWHFPLDISGKQNPEYSFMNCSKGNNCTNINITNGKLYICPVIAYSKYFNRYFNKNLLLEESDYLTLKNIKDFSEIEHFIAQPKPFCRFCDVRNRTFDNKWEISNKMLAEWT